MATVKSISSLEERLRIIPDSLAFARLADLYRKTGKIDRAIDICEKGIKLNPAYITGHLVLSRCYLKQKRLEEAAETLKKVCAMDWRNIAAIWMLADIYLQLGLTEKAGDLCALLVKLDPWDKFAGKKAAQFKGSGTSDLLEIIKEPLETDLDRTVVSDKPLQFVKKPVKQDLGISFESTQILADASSAAEEMMTDATSISGSDVSDRMSSLFGEKPAAPKSSAPQAPSPEEKFAGFGAQQYVDSTTTMSSRDDILGKDTIKMPSLKEPPAPQKPLEVALEETMIMDADEAMILKGDSGIRIKDMGAPTSLKPPVPGKKDKGDGIERARTQEILKETISQAIDTSAIDEMAGKSQESLDDIISGVTEESPKNEARADETLEAAVFEPPQAASRTESGAEETLSGDDVVERLEGIFKDKKGKREPEPRPSKEETKTKAVKGADTAGDASETFHIGMPDEDNVEKTAVLPPAPDDTLSGDDVMERLDGIFKTGKKKEKETAPDLSAAAAAPAVPPPAKQEETDTSRTKTQGKAKADDTDTKWPAARQPGDDAMDEGPERTAVEKMSPSIPALFDSGADQTEQFEETLIFEVPEGIKNARKEKEKKDSDREDTLSLSETISAAKVEAPGGTKDPNEKTVSQQMDREDTLSLSETISSTKINDRDADSGKTTPLEKAKNEDTRESTAVFEDFSPGLAPKGSASPLDIPVFEPKPVVFSAAEIVANIDKKENPDDLPDQVLSPTLANIYIEQGQPQFALKIYQRLAAKDPANQEIQQKISDVEKRIAKGAGDAAPPKPRRGRARKKTPSAKAASTSSLPEDTKVRLPLAGVRLRKKLKPKRKSTPGGAAGEQG
jgi:hypothetical protein